MDTTVLVVLVIVLLILFGGGGWYYRRGSAFGGYDIIGLLVAILVVFLVLKLLGLV